MDACSDVNNWAAAFALIAFFTFIYFMTKMFLDKD